MAEAVHVGRDSANGCELWISQPRSKCRTFPRKPYGTLLYISKLTGLKPVNIWEADERCANVQQAIPLRHPTSINLQPVVALLLLLSV